MMFDRARMVLLVGLMCGAQALAQELSQLKARLSNPSARARATVELRRLGAPAAKALVSAIADGDAQAEGLAEVLGELGAASAREVGRLVELIPVHPEPVRTSLLRALANGLLQASEDDCNTVRAVLPDWARAFYFYTEDPNGPTFAWCEYVRIKRRLVLQSDPSVRGLHRSLARILAGRRGIAFNFKPKQVYDLGAYRQHATREELEGVAELALQHGEDARDIVTELAQYLSCEKPRPGIILSERCAGIGESAPVMAAGVKHPTLWRRDDWRFAIARAVVVISGDVENRVHAVRHLLHAPLTADRLAALERVRGWPQPWTVFTADLAACLGDQDRIVIRDALVMLGLSQGVEMPVNALRELADGKDRELAVLARRLLL